MIAPLRPTLLFLRSKWQWNSTFALTHTPIKHYTRPGPLDSTARCEVIFCDRPHKIPFPNIYTQTTHDPHTHRHTLIKRNNLTWQRNFRMWHSSGNSSENCDYNSLRMKSIMFSLSLFRSLCRFLFCLSVFGWYVSPGIASTSTLTRRKRRRKKSEKLPLITNWFRLNPDHWWMVMVA